MYHGWLGLWLLLLLSLPSFNRKKELGRLLQSKMIPQILPFVLKFVCSVLSELGALSFMFLHASRLLLDIS